jgi:hypothetical protein
MLSMEFLEKLESQQMTIIVEPTNGGTIRHIGRDSNPNNNVLSWYEWKEPLPLPLEFAEGESHKHWLSRYRGGWQFLTPNAGKECVHNGQLHSFHGASSILPWEVTTRNNTSLVMELNISNSLHLKRSLSIHPTKSILHCKTEIENISLTPQEIVMVEHVAFQGSATSEVSAPEESSWVFPTEYEEDGVMEMLWKESGIDRPDLRTPIKDKFSRLAYLSEGNEGWISIFDEKRKIGARLKWDVERFPYLWFWQERFSPGFPFYGRAEMTALEPASIHPNEALEGASKSGRSTIIPVNEKISFDLDLEIF